MEIKRYKSAVNTLPTQTKFARKIALNNDYNFKLLDKGENCLFKITKNGKSFIAGSGSLCSYPMNNAFSASLVNDKVFTNYILDHEGITNLGGRCFFLCPEGLSLRGEGHEVEDAYNYFEELGEVAFIKPLKGSLGHFAEIVKSITELESYISRCSKSHDSIVMQKYFLGTEYRVFILGSEPLFCLKKNDVTICGDGKSTLEDLLCELNKDLQKKSISAYPESTIIVNTKGESLKRITVLEPKEQAIIPGRRNISLGVAPQLIEPIPEELKQLALKSHKAVGLEVSAIDFMCTGNHEEGFKEIRVIEINANPWINSLEILDRWDLIEKVWLYVFESGLAT